VRVTIHFNTREEVDRARAALVIAQNVLHGANSDGSVTLANGTTIAFLSLG
jgi:hypothetical protein